MDRRAFIIAIALDLAMGSVVAQTRPAAKTWRIGYLTPSEIPMETLIATFRELGYVEGQTARFEVRTAQNDLDRLPGLAVELARTPVDIIIAVSPPAIVAAKKATATIPIVMGFWGGEGLVESGVVASFARPGGNVTGVYMLAAELDVKRFELLLEAVPKARIVAVLNPGRGWSLAHLQKVAETHRIQLLISDVPGPDGYGLTFATMHKAKADVVVVPSFPRFFLEHQLIISAAAMQKIPAIYEWGEDARAGGLMAYGPVIGELNRQVATYVDKILKGAKPGNLAVEQPSNFELVINLKTAKELGLTIPQSLLLRADEVIE